MTGAPETNPNSKPAEPRPAVMPVRVVRYTVARLCEPVTWVGLAILWKTIGDNIHHLLTVETMAQVGMAACAVITRSPGSPWEIGARNDFMEGPGK